MTTTTILPIFGMTCNGCVQSIKNTLQQLDGITKLEVDLAHHQATIEYNQTKLSQNDLICAIEEAGFSTTADE